MNPLTDYTLHLADNALILGHRNSEWTGHGPVLEQDIAISNIALDLIGQARNFYQYTATIINTNNSYQNSSGQEASEDTLAYLRDAWDFKNCLLVEQPNGDWAKTILRQFFFSSHQFYFYKELQNSTDNQLAAIAEKSFKETTYHLKWSSEWVVRLGDGTNESNERMKSALDELLKYLYELVSPAEFETELHQSGIAVDLNEIKLSWLQKINEVFDEATLLFPKEDHLKMIGLEGGKSGRHTESLGYILADMQFLQRAYPGCEW